MKNKCHFYGECEFNADDFHDYDVFYVAFYTTVLEAFRVPVEAWYTDKPPYQVLPKLKLCKQGRRQWHPTPVQKIPWTEEPGRLQPLGLLRVGHD